MKKVILFLLSVILHLNQAGAQPIFEENFNYPEGILTVVSNDWTEFPLLVNKVHVIEGSLSYPGYPSSGSGNMIFLDAGVSRSGALRSFTPISGNGKNVYVSLLMNVIDTLEFYSAPVIRVFPAENIARLYLHVNKIPGLGQYRLGISKNGTAALYYNEPLEIQTTYLVVISYHFRVQYDSLQMWINPDLSGGIPLAQLQYCPASGDAPGLERINIIPSVGSGNIYLDGIRLDTTWAQAPLPVELSSFTALVQEDRVLLEWKTETEVDNYGFEIEKFKHNGSWERIGFIEGYGSCNTPKFYSFCDRDIFNYSNINYRLKQIDTDGSYSYSKEINVLPFIPGNIFLFQNYPNPFNPVTRIRYHIPSGSNEDNAFVTLKIFNTLGKEISIPVNGINGPGTHEVTFNSNDFNLPGGIYFYRLTVQYNSSADVFNEVRKFIILK